MKISIFLAIFVICTVLHVGQTFTDKPRVQSYFKKTKCESDAYNNMFQPSSASGSKRMFRFAFSQVVLVGVITHKNKVPGTATGNEFTLTIKVDCYLRGNMGRTDVTVLGIGSKDKDNRCYSLETGLEVNKRVMVSGNVMKRGSKYDAIYPVEGGVEVLGAEDAADNIHYKMFRCGGLGESKYKLDLVKPGDSKTKFCMKDSTCKDDDLDNSFVDLDLSDPWNAVKDYLLSSYSTATADDVRIKEPFKIAAYSTSTSSTSIDSSTKGAVVHTSKSKNTGMESSNKGVVYSMNKNTGMESSTKGVVNTSCKGATCSSSMIRSNVAALLTASIACLLAALLLT